MGCSGCCSCCDWPPRNERRQSFNVLLACRQCAGARVSLLRLFLRLLLLARIERLRFARRERFAARKAARRRRRTLVGKIAALIAGLLIIRLALSKLLLRCRDQAEVMFRVLIVVFGRDRVTGALRITGQLQIFFSNVRCRSSNFYVRPIGLVYTRQWILMMLTPPLRLRPRMRLFCPFLMVCYSANPLICGSTDAALLELTERLSNMTH